jgi:hypothetical protein
MTVYELSDNSAFERQWTVAATVRATSHTIKWYCDQCGRGAEYPAGAFDAAVEGGSRYPDLLLCGAFPFLIISERVASALRGAGIASFIEYPVRIVAAHDTELKPESAPSYRRVELTGNCRIDLLRSGITVTDVCGRCGEPNRQPATTRPLRLLGGSWDGSDLFRDCRYFPHVSFCTEKVVDIVHAHRFANFRFDPME